MKIALCFSGQPRNVLECYTSIRDKLMLPNKITDVFIHTWWRNEWEENQPYKGKDSGHNREPTVFDKNAISDIINLYKPIYIETEDDRINDVYIEETFFNDPVFDYRRMPYDRIYNCLLSMYKANELKGEYEKQKNFEYDAVIKLRFDFYLFNKIIIRKLDLNYINLFNISWNLEDNKAWVDDIFAIGNKKNMDIYCSAVNYIKEHDQNFPNFLGPNGILAYILSKNNIEWKIPFNLGMDGNIFRDSGIPPRLK